MNNDDDDDAPVGSSPAASYGAVDKRNPNSAVRFNLPDDASDPSSQRLMQLATSSSTRFPAPAAAAAAAAVSGSGSGGIVSTSVSRPSSGLHPTSSRCTSIKSTGSSAGRAVGSRKASLRWDVHEVSQLFRRNGLHMEQGVRAADILRQQCIAEDEVPTLVPLLRQRRRQNRQQQQDDDETTGLLGAAGRSYSTDTIGGGVSDTDDVEHLIASLDVRPVDITERIRAILDSSGAAKDEVIDETSAEAATTSSSLELCSSIFFLPNTRTAVHFCLAFVATLGWMMLPCKIPQSFYIQLFAFAFGLFLSLTLSLFSVTALCVVGPRKLFLSTWERLCFAAVALISAMAMAGSITQVLIQIGILHSNVRVNYWSSALALLFAAAMYFRWVRLQHPRIVTEVGGVGWTVATLFAGFSVSLYIFLLVMLLLVNTYSSLKEQADGVWHYVIIVVFFLWNAAFRRLHETLLRKLVSEMNKVKDRVVAVGVDDGEVVDETERGSTVASAADSPASSPVAAEDDDDDDVFSNEDADEDTAAQQADAASNTTELVDSSKPSLQHDDDVDQQQQRTSSCSSLHTTIHPRHPCWSDFTSTQAVLFFHSAVQFAAYRSLFSHTSSVPVTVVLLLSHQLSEIALYPLRLQRKVRLFERSLVLRIPDFIRKRLVEPLLPLPIWIDLLCIDFFLKKLAEIVTLLFYIFYLVVFRHSPIMSQCYQVSSLPESSYRQLLIVAGVQLALEIFAGTLTRYFIVSKHNRGFLFAALLEQPGVRLLVSSVICFSGALIVVAAASDKQTFTKP